MSYGWRINGWHNDDNQQCRQANPAIALRLLSSHLVGWITEPGSSATSHAMKIPIRLLKGLIWVYSSLGVLIILAIAYTLFVLPLFSPDGGVSTDTLDVMEKILLYWGIILFPFLKIAHVYVKRHRHGKIPPNTH
jgi:hypothetical protein